MLGKFIYKFPVKTIANFYKSMDAAVKICYECKGKLDHEDKPSFEEYETHNSPNVATDAVVLRKHKTDDFHDILLIRRAHNPFKGKLALPGGFVDYNEDPQQSCLRELKEECNLEGLSIELLTVKSNPKRDPRKHIVSIVYLVKVAEEAVPQGGDDASEAVFYDLKEIFNSKDELAFDHSEIIEELFDKNLKNLNI